MDPVTAGVAAASLLVSAGTGVFSAFSSHKANKRALRVQQQELEMQRQELERQKRREQENQRRENEQLMNSVANLTNTSFGGMSSPSVAYDKYGDLG